MVKYVLSRCGTIVLFKMQKALMYGIISGFVLDFINLSEI